MDYVGKCVYMCPIDEFNFRKHHKLIHPLEIWDNETMTEAKIENCIKEFHRSAAGETICYLENLRPSKILLETTEYLLTVILKRSGFSFSTIYDFVFDRLRSVRQDTVIQRLEETDSKTCIIVLQRCVRFYLYASYKLFVEADLKIDQSINKSHLLDCLKSLIRLYISKALPVNEMFECPSTTAASILLNINSFEIVTYILKSYPKWILSTPEMSLVIRIYIAYHNKNFIQINKAVMDLIDLKSYIPLYALLMILNSIRKEVLLMLCHSHNSKQLSFAGYDLCKWLIIKTPKGVLSFCESLGFAIINGKSVRFTKDNQEFLINARVICECIVLATLHSLENNQELYKYFKNDKRQ